MYSVKLKCAKFRVILLKRSCRVKKLCTPSRPGIPTSWAAPFHDIITLIYYTSCQLSTTGGQLTDIDASDVDFVALVDVAGSTWSRGGVDVILVAVLVLVLVVVVVVVGPVARRPLHLVLLLQPAPRVREPRRHLRQRHLGDDRQHDLLALGRVRVLDVLVQPRLERARRLARRVLPAHVQRSVTVHHTVNTDLVTHRFIFCYFNTSSNVVHSLVQVLRRARVYCVN